MLKLFRRFKRYYQANKEKRQKLNKKKAWKDKIH